MKVVPFRLRAGMQGKMQSGAWRCTMMSLLVLGAFMAANLAGCGGGGGSGGGSFDSVTLTIRAISINGTPFAGSTITLTNSSTGESRTGSPANANGEFQFNQVRTGTYRVAISGSGQADSTIVVAFNSDTPSDRNQTIVVVPGFNGGNQSGTGAIGLLIDSRAATPGPGTCGTTEKYLGQTLIRVRDVSDLSDPKFVNSVVRTRQSETGTSTSLQGRFAVSVPYAGTFQLVFSQGPSDAQGVGPVINARSRTFSVARNQVANLGNICVFGAGIVPTGAPEATATPTSPAPTF